MLFANVDDKKRLAEPALMGVCPGCGAPMIPKCGSLKQWHWAHSASSDCDPWSEPTGPWHLSWQQPLFPEYVEVLIPPHRADIMGKDGTVIELQHSPISVEEIQERERFYGNMIWLFDATFRFRHVCSGDLVFFAFGRTKHIIQCQKPVFLDFGNTIVQVERFTNVFPECSGVGRARDRNSFVAEYLSNCICQDVKVSPATNNNKPLANPWNSKCPYHAMKHETHWIDPMSSDRRVAAKGSPCLRLNFVYRSDKRPIYHDIIDQFPAISIGWEKSELQEMITLLSGMAVIFDGRLRVMPEKADKMRVRMTVSTAAKLLAKAEEPTGVIRLQVFCTLSIF